MGKTDHNTEVTHSLRQKKLMIISGAILLTLLLILPGYAADNISGKQNAPHQAIDTSYPTITQTTEFILLDTSTATNLPTLQNEASETSMGLLTEEPTQTPTSTPTNRPLVFLPVLIKPFPTATPTSTSTARPPETFLVCDSLSQPLQIPDNDPSGIQDIIQITDRRLIERISVYVDVSHTWVGDLQISLERQDLQQTIRLLDQPGVPASNYGCGADHLVILFDHRASQLAENKCASSPMAISGTYLPVDSVSILDGQSIEGNWSLRITDRSAEDSGQLNRWCLEATIGDLPPTPTPSPTPVNLPSSALIYGITGEGQLLPLDCEARSAVDWANYFGIYIDELDFFFSLPESDDPDTGFVGDVNGTWGQIPPNDYGVHAAPVAELLRAYGLTAYAYRSLSWDELRAEIAGGRPVIVWVIGSVLNGIPRYYTANSNQHTTIVARYEHTVMVIGYSTDNVNILDGGSIYTRSIDQFLDSWSALRNMAVLGRP
jgi:subtilisin-like proprotein convertase family protein/uncharacterized protein YvpB